MVKPNTKFDLNVKDIALIETALRSTKPNTPEEAINIANLLGKIHNQKNWYRPNDPGYVSG